jgi:ribonuclease PH
VTRADGRKPDELRPVEIVASIAPNAKGSALVRAGKTQVICAVSVDSDVPRWMKVQKVPGGWLTAEYGMLPYSTPSRTRREVADGKPGGRTHEIQRLIGRSLRAVTDLERLGPRTVWIDCDVLQADGGTRTAAITGSYVAFRLAVDAMLREGTLKEDPLRESVAAVSVGLVGGHPLLDLCYEEDAAADVDMNLVMTGSGRFIEVQGTAEESPFAKRDLSRLLALGEKGIRALLRKQAAALKGDSASR